MNHDEYVRHIQSRGDLDPDQKNILIQNDLNRRRGSIHTSSSLPTRPTREDLEIVEEFEKDGTIWIVGKNNDHFWFDRCYPTAWFGPGESFQEVKETAEGNFGKGDIKSKTVDYFEEVEEFVHDGNDWIVGKVDEQVWANSRLWLGPKESIGEIKDWVENDQLDEGLKDMLGLE